MITTSSHYSFSFGTNAHAASDASGASTPTLNVRATTRYTARRGYGIVDARTVAGATTAEQALHNGGWNCRTGYVPALENAATGVYLTDARDVLVFKARVSDYGVYRVQVTVHAARGDIRELALFGGRRAAVARKVALAAGESRTFTFYAVAAPYIPAFTSAVEREAALYVSVTGENAGLSALVIDKADVPVLWVAGDSTLTDQNALFPYYADYSCGGWAQALPRYLDGMAVCNYAHSGMTTNCFRDDGHWALLTAQLRAGDAVLFQFGHNDQKRRNLAPFGGYSENLRRYVRETRSLGAVPLIASPISRIPFDDNGTPHSLLAPYALACAAVADELSVPFIDLHALTFARWNALEEEARGSCGEKEQKASSVSGALVAPAGATARPHAAMRYFMRGDITHTNDIGADFIAALAVVEVRRQSIAPLCAHLAATPAPLTLNEVPAPTADAGAGSIFDIALPYVDAGRGATRQVITRAFRNGLLDPCVLHVHPRAQLPRAQLLMPLFKALRMSGKRPYLGAFDDLSRYDWDAGYVQACLDAGLLDAPAAGSAPARFYPDEPTTADFFALLTVRALEPVQTRDALTATDCLQRALQLGLVPAASSARSVLTRADCYGGMVRLMELLGNATQALPSDVEQHPTV